MEIRYVFLYLHWKNLMLTLDHSSYIHQICYTWINWIIDGNMAVYTFHTHAFSYHHLFLPCVPTDFAHFYKSKTVRQRELVLVNVCTQVTIRICLAQHSLFLVMVDCQKIIWLAKKKIKTKILFVTRKEKKRKLVLKIRRNIPAWK